MTKRCKNVASSFFPPKHQIVVAGQLSFSGKSGVRLLDCTSSILIQDGGGATETQRDGLRWRTSPQQHRRSLVPGLPKIRRNLADSYMAATSIWTYSCLTPTWAQGGKDHVMETLKWPLMSEMTLSKPYFPTVPTCVKMLCVWLRSHLESASGATRSLSVPM